MVWHLIVSVSDSPCPVAGFTIIAIGCGIIAYLLVHESRAWRNLVWDVLHATGITDTQHKTLRDLVSRLEDLQALLVPSHPHVKPLSSFQPYSTSQQ